MRAAATVKPVAFSQRLFCKGNQPSAAFRDATNGFVVGKTDHRDEKGSFAGASGTYPIGSDAVHGVATLYVPNREEIQSFQTTLNVPGDDCLETTASETLEEQVVRPRADSSGECIAGQVNCVPLLKDSGQSRVRAGWKNHTNGLIGLPAGVPPRRWGLLRPETSPSWKEIIG
jgi:hypothetical protein